MTTDPTDNRLCWIDLRRAGERAEAVRAEAIHQRADAIVSDDPDVLRDAPPTLRRVLLLTDDPGPVELAGIDVVIADAAHHGAAAELARRSPSVQCGRFIEVVDRPTLDEACHSARTEAWTVIEFADPTKIPLEIVLAAAAGAPGRVVTVATDPDDAAVLFGVLERGPEGVMLAPDGPGVVSRLLAAAQDRTPELELVELEVVATTAVGMGERACVDTCSYLRPDEGLLVGSHAKGLVLCVSETHPLPYMPTRPFRVNAGAIMSYTMSVDGRTRYLSELEAGSTVLAVDAKGATRPVTVGRTKIESRPLLSVDAVAPDGRRANLILQHDWHVRLLGPGGAVLNCTELRPGDRLLGYLPQHERHVGHPIDELCYER
jgi:3-amino-4-hydroxybenzoic acid synthase